MREQRLVFGQDAELYDRARPSYPDALVDDVVALVGSSGRALDVGAGTGKASVLLAGRGLAGVALEPDAAMADVARLNLGGNPRWTVEVAGLEEWQPAKDNGVFDLVCCAQAWHWLDPAVRAHKAHGLLRPGGWLALWWNRPDEDGSAIRQAMDEVSRTLVPALPTRGIGSKGRPAISEVPPGLGFGPPLERRYRWSQAYTAAQWSALLRTQSDHALLSADQLQPLLTAIEAVIDDHGGSYRHPYVTWLWAVRRT